MSVGGTLSEVSSIDRNSEKKILDCVLDTSAVKNLICYMVSGKMTIVNLDTHATVDLNEHAGNDIQGLKFTGSKLISYSSTAQLYGTYAQGSASPLTSLSLTPGKVKKNNFIIIYIKF